MTEAKWEQLCAAVAALDDAGVPSHIQSLLLYGDPEQGVQPRALERAIVAAARAAVVTADDAVDDTSRLARVVSFLGHKA